MADSGGRPGLENDLLTVAGQRRTFQRGSPASPLHPPIRGIGHQSSCCYFDCIVQIKAAAVKGRVCGVQNDKKKRCCHAERSKASRLTDNDIPFVMQSETKHLG